MSFPLAVGDVMSLKVTRLLEILGDGKWHETKQLRQLVDLTDGQVEQLTDFLGRYDFAKIDESKNRVRISKEFKKVLTDVGQPQKT